MPLALQVLAEASITARIRSQAEEQDSKKKKG
jgi:hypothetical protein